MMSRWRSLTWKGVGSGARTEYSRDIHCGLNASIYKLYNNLDARWRPRCTIMLAGAMRCSHRHRLQHGAIMCSSPSTLPPSTSSKCARAAAAPQHFIQA